MTEIEAVYYGKQILEVIEYMHMNKIIHRNITLDNIFIDDKMNIRIGAFELALKINEEGQRS